MWRLKQFMPKESVGLEGKTLEIGKLKVHVSNTIAEGGFSVVYLSKCTQTGQLYALKHILCNEEESSSLLKKEISTMLSLKGHPNVVTLHAHSTIKSGRYEESFLLMDHCEKMLTHVIESRGSTYFEEKQALLIFRDVCNAVFAMHTQTPPIAHRDLKTENVLLSNGSVWKLCDFGSVSTNHRRIESSVEIGIEEEKIRKQTTPSYRAPELCDLYAREMISEKVDIWALGCLLYQLAYFKTCFDGESKLQILNGNYKIPETPKYSPLFLKLLKDMLCINPSERPDISQVWHRVNGLLPIQIRRPHPDQAPSVLKQMKCQDASPIGRRSPSPHSTSPSSPLPSSARMNSPRLTPRRQASPLHDLRRSNSPKPKLKKTNSDERSGGNSVEKSNSSSGGTFWATAYSQGTESEDSQLDFDPRAVTVKQRSSLERSSSGSHKPNLDSDSHSSVPVSDSQKPPRDSHGKGTRSSSPSKVSKNPEVKSHPYGEFHADFDVEKIIASERRSGAPDSRRNSEEFDSDRKDFSVLSTGRSVSDKTNRSTTRDAGSEGRDANFSAFPDDKSRDQVLTSLQEELKRVNEEKDALAIRCDKLSFIVGSQMQEIQELKNALENAAKTIADAANLHVKPIPPPRDWAEPENSRLGTFSESHTDVYTSKPSKKSSAPATSYLFQDSNFRHPSPRLGFSHQGDSDQGTKIAIDDEHWAKFEDDSPSFGFSNTEKSIPNRFVSPQRVQKSAARKESPRKGASPLKKPADAPGSKDFFSNWDSRGANADGFSGSGFNKAPAGWDQF